VVFFFYFFFFFFFFVFEGRGQKLLCFAPTKLCRIRTQDEAILVMRVQ
jgi:hypothetical protein